MSITEIKNNLKGKRLVLGTDLTMKQLKLGNMVKVFLSNNCSEISVRNISYYCSVSSCAVEKLKIPNDELGVVCKKPFSVSVVGLLKQ